jgi:hypothetical protein
MILVIVGPWWQAIRRTVVLESLYIYFSALLAFSHLSLVETVGLVSQVA